MSQIRIGYLTPIYDISVLLLHFKFDYKSSFICKFNPIYCLFDMAVVNFFWGRGPCIFHCVADNDNGALNDTVD